MFGKTKKKAEKKDTIDKEKDKEKEPIALDEQDMENPDIEVLKNPTAPPQGVGADDYGNYREKHSDDPQLINEVEQKEGIFIRYCYTGDDVREGLTAFQNATIMKKNLLYTAILLCIFFAYAVNIVKSANVTLSMFLAIMCVVIMGIIWLLPKQHIKKVADFTDKNMYNYTMTVFDTCVRLGGAALEDGSENGSFLYSYGKEITQIFETVNLFLVCAGKEQIFILPKRFLTGEVTDDENEFRENAIANGDIEEDVRNIFKAGMGNKFISKII